MPIDPVVDLVLVVEAVLSPVPIVNPVLVVVLRLGCLRARARVLGKELVLGLFGAGT